MYCYIKELYNSNKEIKEYIDKFARDRMITVDEAMGQQVVAEYIKYKVSKF